MDHAKIRDVIELSCELARPEDVRTGRRIGKIIRRKLPLRVSSNAPAVEDVRT